MVNDRYHASDKAGIFAKSRDRYARKIEQYRMLGRKSALTRRARLREVFVEPVDPMVVLAASGGKCGICGDAIDASSKWDVDHVVPLSKGGIHAYSNVQAAHARCNRAKGAKLLKAS